MFVDDWEDYIPEPPDGGWGWVVMIASFVNNFILDGLAYCFGIFLLEYSKSFQASVGSTSLANSLLCGTYLLVGGYTYKYALTAICVDLLLHVCVGVYLLLCVYLYIGDRTYY